MNNPDIKTEFNGVKDSGQHQEFDTGSRRDSRDGKGRFDLLSPIVLMRDAKHLENGAKKYGDRNWEKGQPLSRFLDSALRHLFKYLEGHRDEDHLAAARWNVGAIIHIEEAIKRGLLPASLNDLPSFVQPDAAGREDAVNCPSCGRLLLPGMSCTCGLREGT